jgi:hypothetical protein
VLIDQGNSKKGETMWEDRLLQKAFRTIKLFGIVIFSLILLMGSVATTIAAESIAISCYIGNRYVGSAVVYDVINATNACNNLYVDCRGKCSGCFQDLDYDVAEVCINTNTQKYLRY